MRMESLGAGKRKGENVPLFYKKTSIFALLGKIVNVHLFLMSYLWRRLEIFAS